METSTIINNYPLSPEAIEAVVADARRMSRFAHEQFLVYYAQQETPSEINNHVLAHFQSDERKRRQQRDLDEIRHCLSMPPTKRLSFMVENWLEFLQAHRDFEDEDTVNFLKHIKSLLCAGDNDEALRFTLRGPELLGPSLPGELDIEHSRVWSDVEMV